MATFRVLPHVNTLRGMIQLQHHRMPILGPQLLHRLLDALHVAGRDVGPGGGRIPFLAFDQTVQLIEAEWQRLARPDGEQPLAAGRRRHLDVEMCSGRLGSMGGGGSAC